MPRPFFFSYAHNDALDDHLDDFFTEVNRRVRFLTGSNQDGFRDDQALRAGEEWSRELVAELRITPAIICLYSESYFRSTVCSRELQVLLERRLKYKRENTGSRPGNIIPVLWQPADIPIALPDFQFEKPQSREFANQGVWYVRDFSDDRKEFKQIAQDVAVRVKEANKVVLPDLGIDPILGGIESAFEPPPLPRGEFDATPESGPGCVTYVYANAPPWHAWPFAPTLKPLLHLSAAVAKGRDLQSHQLTFDPAQGRIGPRLDELRKKNNLIVFLVDGSSLANPALCARLREYDDKKLDACSTLIVWPAGTRTPALQQLVDATFPALSRRQPPSFYHSIEQPAQFIDAVRASVDALGNAVLKDLQGVPPQTPTSGYSSVPSVTGPGGADRRAA